MRFFINMERLAKRGDSVKGIKIPDFFAVLSTILTELYFNH